MEAFIMHSDFEAELIEVVRHGGKQAWNKKEKDTLLENQALCSAYFGTNHFSKYEELSGGIEMPVSIVSRLEMTSPKAPEASVVVFVVDQACPHLMSETYHQEWSL